MALDSNKKTLEFEFGADTAQLEKQLTALKRQIQDVVKALSPNQKLSALDNIADDAKAGIVPLTNLRSEITKTVQEAAKSKNNQAEFVNDTKLQQNTVHLKQFKQELGNVATQVVTFKEKMAGIGQALQAAFLPLTGISAGITALLGSSSKDFAAFEKTLNTIAAVSEVTDSELQKIKQTSLELGQSTIFSNQQVAESYLELTRAGFTANESLEALPGLLKLAAAAGGDLSVATTAVSEGMRAFGLSTQETGRFVDVLAQAANKSSADVGDLAFAFKQIAPLARQTGQSVEATAALLAVLADNGVKASDAGSDLRNIITRLLSPSKEAAATLKALNVSLTDQQGNIKPLSQFFNELQKSMSKYNDASKATAASNIAGAENLKSFLILAGQAPGSIDGMVASMNDASGAADRMANTINKGLFASLEQLAGSFDTLKTTLGEALAPAIQVVAGALTNLKTLLAQNKGVTQFIAGASAIAASVTTVGAAIGGLLLLLNPLSAALETSLGAIVATFAALTTAGGVLTVAMNNVNQKILASNPIVQALRNAYQQLKDKLNELFNALGDLGTQIGRAIGFLVDLAAKALNSRAGIAILNSVVFLLKATIDGATKTVKDFATFIDAIATAAKIATTAVSGLYHAAKDLKDLNFQGVLKDLAETSNQIQNQIGGALERGAERYGKVVSNTAKTIQNALLKPTGKEDPFNSPVKVTGKSKLVLPNDSAAKKAKREAEQIAAARKQLNDLVQSLEVDLTGFTKGEFAKRSAEAKKAYREEVRQIQELGQKGKVSQAEITKDIQKARQLLQEKQKQIRDEQKAAFAEADRFTATIKANIQSINASLTQGNPFDDIEASAQAATTEIKNGFDKAIEDLNNKLRSGNIRADQFAEQKKQLDEQFEIQKQAIEQKQKLEIQAAIDAQNIVAKEVLAIQAQMSGKQLDIIEKTNDVIIQDLQQKADIANKNALDALKAYIDDSSKINEAANKNAVTNAVKANADLNNAQLKKASDLSTERVNQQNIIVAQIQKEIDLHGEKDDLLIQQQEALKQLIRLLSLEAEITSKTEEERAKIKQQIDDLRVTLAQSEVSTSSFGKILKTFSTINLPNNQFTNFFQNTSDNLLKLDNQFQEFKDKTGNDSFFAFLKDNKAARTSLLQTGAQAVSLISQQFSKGKNSIGKTIANTLTSALSGALTGFATGGPIGALAGGLLGSVSGASSSGFFSSKAGVATAFALGGPLGFLALGASKRQKELEKAQKNLQKTQRFVDSILKSVDQNNILDLQAKLNQVMRFKSGGGDAFQVKKDAAIQLQTAIQNRQKVIEEAIRDLKFQNGALQKQFAQFDDTPIENLNIDRQINLDALANERDKALEQFKDSAVVQAEILKNFELKRQAVIKDSSLAIIEAVIQEQNTIRALRAQAALDDAKVSGNSLAIINAQLQAQLVAIDNDIAAFKGAEETKTEYLKQKAAERNRIITDAQRQVDDLLQEGLDILNQGLVTSQTKADSQAKQLKDLFGTSLNPLGLIQAGGDLVQKNVTITGGIQFTFEGIQDVQALIAQMSDPIIQAKLVALINQALARN